MRGHFPELEYATVKTAKSRALAEPFAPEEVARRIESAAKHAIEKFLGGSFRPYYLPPPYDFQLGFQNWQQADGAAQHPGVMRDGELSVRYRSESFVDGYERSLDVLERSSDTLEVLVRIPEQDAQGEKYLKQLEDTFWTRWLTPKKAAPWMQPGPKPPAKKRFHGDN